MWWNGTITRLGFGMGFFRGLGIGIFYFRLDRKIPKLPKKFRMKNLEWRIPKIPKSSGSGYENLEKILKKPRVKNPEIREIEIWIWNPQKIREKFVFQRFSERRDFRPGVGFFFLSPGILITRIRDFFGISRRFFIFGIEIFFVELLIPTKNSNYNRYI